MFCILQSTWRGQRQGRGGDSGRAAARTAAGPQRGQQAAAGTAFRSGRSHPPCPPNRAGKLAAALPQLLPAVRNWGGAGGQLRTVSLQLMVSSRFVLCERCVFMYCLQIISVDIDSRAVQLYLCHILQNGDIFNYRSFHVICSSVPFNRSAEKWRTTDG